MEPHEMKPPRVAEKLLGRSLPVHERNEILGDMAERYARRVARQGKLRAGLWYWRQAVAVPAHLRRSSVSVGIELGELRYAARVLLKSPAFTAVAVLTLALGIGANTAIFSVVHGVMLRPLPYPEAERLVYAWEHNDSFGRLASAWPNFADWREQNESFDVMATYNGGLSTVLGGAEPLRARVIAVSRGFFEVLSAEPAEGRGFRAEEHVEGASPVVVVSHSFWQDQLGATGDLGSAELMVAGFPVTLVGVMPPDFDFPADTDVWYPTELIDPGTSRTAHSFRVVGRLAEGVTPEQAQQDLTLVTSRIEAGDETSEWLPERALVVPMLTQISGPVQGPLLLLLAASVMVVLVACTNLASTLLARGSARSTELAVLRALGAGRGRIIRRLFAESLLLALFGAAAGLALAAVLIRALPSLLPTDLPRMSEVGLHPAVAGFTVVVSVAAAFLFGLLPAWRVAEGEIGSPLRAGTRGASVAGNRGPWRLLVIGEVALALILLTGAGLLVRSLWEAASVDAGFEPDDVLAMNVSLPGHRYGEIEARGQFFEELVQRIDQLPGVTRAGMALQPPLQGSPASGRIRIDGGPEEFVTAAYQVADRGYFETLQIPLQRGRLFEDADSVDGAHVVVVNQALADLAWPGQDAIGKRLTGGGMDDYWEQPDAWATVVGVVGNIRQSDLTEPTYPTLYFTYRQRPFRAFAGSIMARAAVGEAGDLVGVMRQTVRDFDPDVPVEFATVDALVTRSLGDRRFLADLLVLFAAMGMMLAALGIYGVVGYTVALRRREMGIRMALGSAPRQVLGMVLRESMLTVTIGLVLGLVGALAVARLLAGFLFGVSPADPLAIAVTAVTLLLVAALASFIPARRAATIDPLITMRAD